MMRTWSGLIEIREVWYRSLRLGKRKRKTINKIPKLRRFSKSCTYYNPHSSSQSALFLWCVSIINMLCSSIIPYRCFSTIYGEEWDFCSSFNPTVLKAGSYFWSWQGHQPKNLVLYDRPSSPLKVQLLGIKCLINYYIQGTKRTVDYK